jgi:hypothetical protein
MELNLTNEQKITHLTIVKNNLAMEIFNGLVRLGIDPDEFSSFDDVEVPMYLTPEKDRVATAISAYEMATNKLAEMS